MKKFFAEFKSFALRGNVMDLAVGVIIGAAFQGIVTALVDNIISPLIGLFANTNFDSLTLTVGENVTIKYGAFLTAAINFVIMAFVIFLLVKGLNKLSGIGKKEEAPTTKKCAYCYTEIHVKATRCPNCTVELPTAKGDKEQP